MKKKNLLIALGVLSGLFMFIGVNQKIDAKASNGEIYGFPADIIYIQTPNGTEVEALQAQYDLTDEQKASKEAKYDYWADENIKLSGATLNYNCHSYAWYSQNVATNTCWIADPSSYWLDGSYIRIYENVQPGDIIVYLSSNDHVLHSGIVVAGSISSVSLTWLDENENLTDNLPLND